jgi:hypothetical protein
LPKKDRKLITMPKYGVQAFLLEESWNNEINPNLVGATCLWHPSKYAPKDLATKGLEFLKENATNAGLA